MRVSTNIPDISSTRRACAAFCVTPVKKIVVTGSPCLKLGTGGSTVLAETESILPPRQTSGTQTAFIFAMISISTPHSN